MSDAPQGSGWWQASDGKWYPPELRPGPETPPAPTPTPAQPQQPQATVPPAAAPAADWSTPPAQSVAQPGVADTAYPAATPAAAPVATPVAPAAAPAATAPPAGPSRKWIPQTIIIVDIAILIITLGLVLLQG